MSVGNIPAYFFFQMWYVAWPIPAFLQISAVAMPSWPCLMMNAFCAPAELRCLRALPFLSQLRKF